MKQQKFLFVDLVSLIFLLIIFMGNFLGLLYISEGNLVISTLSSFVGLILYYFIIQFLIKNKELMYKNNFLHLSSFFWIFFLVIGFVSFNLMSHFINIEYNCKNQIQNEASTKIKLVDSIANIYKRRAKEDIQNFEAELKLNLSNYKIHKNNSLKNKLTLAPFNVENTVLNNPDYINVNEVANAKVNPYQIKIENNINNIEKTISKNNKNYQSVFDNWKRTSLMANYTKLNQYVEDNVKLINSKIAELPLNNTEIKFVIDKEQLPLNNPSKLKLEFKPNYKIPLIFIILTHIFILTPFFTWKIKGYVELKGNDPLELENVREI